MHATDAYLTFAVEQLKLDADLVAIVGEDNVHKGSFTALSPSLPLVTVEPLSAPIANGTGGLVAMTSLTFLARVWGGTPQQRFDAEARISAVLLSASGSEGSLSFSPAIRVMEPPQGHDSLPGVPSVPWLGARYRAFIS